MVKSYQRFEQSSVFGVVSSGTNSIWVPSEDKNISGPGKVITGALENVNVWDIKTGELVCHLSDGVPLGSIDARTTKPAETTYLQYYPDTNLLAVGYADGVIKVWDMVSKTVLLSLNGHGSAITQLLFDSAGTRLISGSKDSNIIVWDLVSEIGLYKLRSHKDAITGLWMSGENWLISVSKDGLIKIWDLKIQQCVETHIAHAGECWALAVEGQIVVTTSSDSQIKIWNLNLDADAGSKVTERGIYEKQSRQRGSAVSFTTAPDGVKFFYIQNADKTLEIVRLRKEEEISRALKKREKRFREKGMTDEEIQKNFKESYASLVMHSFQVVRSAFKIKSASWAVTTSSKLELVITTSGNTIEYYSIPYIKREPKYPTPIKLHSIELPGHRTDIRAVDLSDDGKLLATASNGLLKIWNVKTRTCLRTFECGYALTCKFLPGGFLVILGTRSGELQLLDLASSTMLENIEEAHNAAIWSLDVTSDGKKLITGSADKTVKFWNFVVEEKAVDGSVDKLIPTMSLHHDMTLEMNDDVLCVKLSPEDKFLSVSLLNNTVKVFYLESMKFFLSLYGHKLPVLSIDISFDSKLIITSSADKNIKIWGLDFGDCHKSLFAHQDSIMNVKFLPESHNFFSCSKDATVKYWDGDKFEAIQKLSGHQSEVWALAVSRNGECIISVSHDNSIRIWEETDDQVFLEEEHERELEEQNEESLLTSLQEGSGDSVFKQDETSGDHDEAVNVHKQTVESLKAGERLMEAIDLGVPEIEARESYEKELKLWNRKRQGPEPVKPQDNAILLAVNQRPEEYIMATLVRIKPSQLEDALLALPFSYVLKFLKFLDAALQDKNLLNNNLALVCKNLFFVIQSNYRELVSQKNEELKQRITRVKEQLKRGLKRNEEDLGFNIEGLKFIRQQWRLRHNYEFFDEIDQGKQTGAVAKKRVFETLT